MRKKGLDLWLGKGPTLKAEKIMSRDEASAVSKERLTTEIFVVSGL